MKKKQKSFVFLLEDGQKEQYYKTTIYETVRMIILFTGILLSLQDLMYSKICLIISLIVGSVILIIRQISKISDILSKRIDLVLYILGLICLILSNLSLIQAIFDLTNRLIILCNLRFDLSMERFATDSRAALGSIILWILFSGILSGFIYRQLKRRKIYAVLLILILSAMFGFILGSSSMLIPTFLMLISISNIFVYDAAPKREISSRFFICKILSVLLMIGMLSVSSFYIPSQSLENWKEDVSDQIDQWRYGKDSLPKGEFVKAADLLNGTKSRLSVEIDQPQELYLKGFVGASYEYDGWRTLSKDHYEGKYEGILNWLSKKNFDVFTQYASYKKIDSKQNHLNLSKVNVKNTGAYRKYIYLPMTTSSLDAFRSSEDKDWSIRSLRIFGTSDYKFQCVDYTQDFLDITPASWISNTQNSSQKNYQQAESVYDKFVKDSYKDMSSSMKKLMKSTFFYDHKTMNFKDTTTRIRQILRQNLTYKEKPQDIPGDKDYITWLLKDAKEGNAVAYATTAVMAYRSAGYPARYVEGYHLSKDEASQLERDHKKEVALTTKNAHAWVEVYRSGIGWIPVEVVPGMYTETYSTQTVSGKPSYQLKAKKDNSGVNTEQGKSSGHSKDNDKNKKTARISFQNITAVILIILYILLILYLILELQRVIRLHFWKKEHDVLITTEVCAQTLEQLWMLSKIKGDYSQPLTLEPLILAIYPEVTSFEYRRVVSLIQKARFGGKTLKTYEKHTLTCFVHKISHLLWRKQSIFGKIALRYIYIIPKR